MNVYIDESKGENMREDTERKEFLSSVSHEVRTLLNTIVGLSDDISGYETLPDEIREDAEDLNSSSKELFNLIDSIIDYVLIENGQMKMVEAPYNPKALFEEASKVDEELFEDKPIDFHTNIDEKLPYELIGDKTHITKIVRSLITNAIKYTDSGDVWFDVSYINDNDYCNLVISVKDTGRGIPPEEMETLFAKINRLKIERDTVTEGLGLGLAISKSLIEMMNGRIRVESRYGEGSTFEVTIPQKIKQMEESELSRTQRLRLEQISYEEEGYGYKKILIVDDNMLNIKVARRILEQYDLIIEECYNGQECIDMVSESNDFDLILMDMMMPGMSGEETLERLKLIPDFETPVIAVTAIAEPGAQEKYESQGFADYIAKPFSKEELEKKIEKVFKLEDIRDEELEEEYEENQW